VSLSPDHPAAVIFTVIGALWRQKFKALVGFCAVGGAAIALFKYVPRSYESESRLFVRVGRESVALDPTATVGQTIGMQDSRETEINSLMEVLKSRSLHETVVDELGVATILGDVTIAPTSVVAQKDLTPWRLVSAPSVEPIGVTPAASSMREKAVQQVGKSLTVTSPRRSTVISIAGEADSPELAQAIVHALVQAYKKEHVRLHRVQGSFDFFSERAKRTEEAVKLALKNLNEAKSELSIASVQGRRDHLEKQISSLEEQAHSISAELSSASAKVASLEKMLKDLPNEIEGVQTTGFNNDVHTRMREQLYVLELRERDLLSKYREGHPEVVAIRKQVEEARNIMDGQPTNRTQKEMLQNPAIKSVELDLLKGRSDVAALEAKAKSIALQKSEVIDELRELHHNELHLADLDRDLEERRTAHGESVARLEQARMNQDMENDRLSNVNVIQEATFVEKPTSPKLSLFAAAGFMAACFAAISLALLWELAFPPSKSSGRVAVLRESPALRNVSPASPPLTAALSTSERVL
jgi:uncharacterized protein involved in exopolysaccharide biosynthesis